MMDFSIRMVSVLTIRDLIVSAFQGIGIEEVQNPDRSFQEDCNCTEAFNGERFIVFGSQRHEISGNFLPIHRLSKTPDPNGYLSSNSDDVLIQMGFCPGHDFDMTKSITFLRLIGRVTVWTSLRS